MSPFIRVERHVPRSQGAGRGSQQPISCDLRPATCDLMINDLDPLMTARGIGALVIPMHEALHPSFRWITRGAKVTRGYAIKSAGRDPLLVSYPMERNEASATGLRTALVHDFGYDAIFRAAPHHVAAYAELFDRILRAENASGTIAFCGNVPFHLYHGIAELMATRGWPVYRANGEDIIQLARKRKDTWEIDAIASVGARTEEVVDVVREKLRTGKRMRLGELKEVVSHEIARRGMIEDHETILSQGADAGVPHSRGNRDAWIEPSSPIVLDIFPADRDSGYFFDLTRTFCVGPIPDDLAKIHRDVEDAFLLACDKMRPGTPASAYQQLVCDFFEAKGYATMRANPATLTGYVHSLGHGVGLEVHEKPSFSLLPSNHDMIEEGDIVTIEPGLYFPERGIGVRIEDTFVVHDGGVETLCRSSRGLLP